MSGLRKNLGLVYFILPYITPVENKLGLILSIIIGREHHVIKLKNNIVIKFKSSQFGTLLSLLGTLTFSTGFIKKNNKIEFTIDYKNKFEISLDNISYEEHNLLQLLFGGIKFGANFIVESDAEINNYRDKTFRILQHDGKTVIETSSGLKFYLDSIHPGNTIVETFVRSIHMINSNSNWNDKVVIDVGAECGDTSLYFANMGAKVFAFEPIKEYYDDMIRNFSLNPTIASRIIPINAAIGKDGELTFYQSGTDQVGGTSFVSNMHGKNVKTCKAIGYSLESAIDTFQIEHVDLLKMDCKGCESLLTEKSLEKVDKVKIEYTKFDKSYELSDLLTTLKNAGFEFMLYKHDPSSHYSNAVSTTIFGRKMTS